MIYDKDRSFYFGASDADKIVGNRNTKSWLDWWMVKMGINRNNIDTKAMNAGTHKEHQILRAVNPFMETDKQIIIPSLHLRVNLDGNLGSCIYECKTYRLDKGFKLSKKYTQQVNVQMYAYNSRDAYIVSYGLKDEDYNNYFLPIDPDRLHTHKIDYDNEWIDNVFLPNICELSRCLDNGILPERK